MVLLISRFGKGGLGPTVPLFLLFALSSLVLYAVSACDAYRIAAGDDPIVGSRTLLWASAALIMLSVADRELHHVARRPPVASSA